MFSQYRFVWRLELMFAAITWLVYVLTAFVATGDAPVTDWGEWITGTALAGARVTAAGLITGLAKLLTALAARRN